MSQKDKQDKPVVLNKNGMEEMLRTEVDFYDRHGNHAILTKVVYRDRKGKFSEQVVKVQWLSFVPISRLTYIVKVSVKTMKCSNGVFFLTTLTNNHGEELTPYESTDLDKALFEAHDWAKFFHSKAEKYTNTQWITQKEINQAYKDIEFLVDDEPFTSLSITR